MKLNEKAKNIEIKNGVVVVLEALGFKEIWSGLSLMKFLEATGENKDRGEVGIEKAIFAWEDIVQFYKATLDNLKQTREIQSFYERHFVTSFSNVLVLVFESRRGDNPARILPLVGDVLMSAFFVSLSKCIYLRGVISTGELYLSKDVIMGPAVEEALVWYTLPDWVGVSTTPRASFGLETFVEQGLKVPEFVKYNIPTKTGVQENGWALAWPKRLIESPPPHTTPRRIVLDTLIDAPMGFLSESTAKNTLAFFEFVTNTNKKSGQSQALPKGYT